MYGNSSEIRLNEKAPPAHSQQLKKDKTVDKKKFRNGTEQ